MFTRKEWNQCNYFMFRYMSAFENTAGLMFGTCGFGSVTEIRVDSGIRGSTVRVTGVL
jgi:hypothetical protein